jgi:hypothetical protein
MHVYIYSQDVLFSVCTDYCRVIDCMCLVEGDEE